jgi:hypothetical protein
MSSTYVRAVLILQFTLKFSLSILGRGTNCPVVSVASVKVIQYSPAIIQYYDGLLQRPF